MKTEISFSELRELMKIARHKTAEYLNDFEHVESDDAVFHALHSAYKKALADDIAKGECRSCEAYFNWSYELEYKFGSCIRFVKKEGRDKWILRLQDKYDLDEKIEQKAVEIYRIVKSWPHAYIIAMSEAKNRNEYSRNFYTRLLEFLEE